jgi:hypothetical protein
MNDTSPRTVVRLLIYPQLHLFHTSKMIITHIIPIPGSRQSIDQVTSTILGVLCTFIDIMNDHSVTIPG